MRWILAIAIAVQLSVAVLLSTDFGPPEAATLLFVLSTGAVGFLTATKVSDNPIGWLLLSAAVAFASGGLAANVVEAGTVDSQSWSFATSALVGNVAFGVGFGLITTYVLLLFPNGRLLSPRWRVVGWMAGVGLTLLLASIALAPSTFDELPIKNPIGLESAGLLRLIEGGALLLVVPAVFASAASMVVRFQRANPVERQQLKWVVWSVVVMIAALVATGVAHLSDDIENAITSGAAALIPVAMGIAIQRYRLYEIDRIISRTITYGLISSALVAVYAGLVFVLTNLIRLEGDLAVAAATLGAAALFSPLRRRLQAMIDRRFNRSGATAVSLVDSFTRLLPTRVDLFELTREVRTVVGQTMQPAVVSLWLRRQAD